MKDLEYIGWYGFGPRLGTRCFMGRDGRYIVFVQKSMLGGRKTQWMANESIIHRTLYAPSMFYLVCGVVGSALFDIGTVVDAVYALQHNAANGLGKLWWRLTYFVIVGLILSWLFSRPRIVLFAEGGITIGSHTGFNAHVLRLVQKRLRSQGSLAAESSRTRSAYLGYAARSDRYWRAISVLKVIIYQMVFIVCGLLVSVTLIAAAGVLAYVYLSLTL